MSNGTSEPNDLSTADTMGERSERSGRVLWLLMNGDRVVVTGVLALLVFAGFVAAGALGSGLGSDTAIQYLFSSMIGAVVTGTTLVLTISQLIVSQENGPLGDQHQRMSMAMDVRGYVGEIIGTTTPADPSALLRALVEAAERRVEALDRLVYEHENDELRRQVDAFVDSVHENAHEVENALEGQEFGTFEVVSAALNFNYSWKIYQVERLVEEFGDELTEAQLEAFEEARTAFVMFGPVREHVKTLYFEWELANLSRYILYVAIPALVVAATTLMFVDPNTFSGTTLGVPDEVWVLGAAFALTSLPFLLFAAYITRIVTIAKRTLAIGPLILRS